MPTLTKALCVRKFLIVTAVIVIAKIQVFVYEIYWNILVEEITEQDHWSPRRISFSDAPNPSVPTTNGVVKEEPIDALMSVDEPAKVPKKEEMKEVRSSFARSFLKMKSFINNITFLNSDSGKNNLITVLNHLFQVKEEPLDEGFPEVKEEPIADVNTLLNWNEFQRFFCGETRLNVRWKYVSRSLEKLHDSSGFQCQSTSAKKTFKSPKWKKHAWCILSLLTKLIFLFQKGTAEDEKRPILRCSARPPELRGRTMRSTSMRMEDRGRRRVRRILIDHRRWRLVQSEMHRLNCQ